MTGVAVLLSGAPPEGFEPSLPPPREFRQRDGQRREVTFVHVRGPF